MGAKRSSKSVKAAQQEDSGSDGESQSGESSQGDEGPRIDGLSSVISKIVNQKVTKDIPVLEKRKTTNVQKDEKEREEETPKKKKGKIAASEPEDEATVQARALASLTKERNLKKIATKGVVALFNAIMESKRKEEDDGEDDGGQKEAGGKVSETDKKKEMNESVKKLTKTKFLNLLTGDDQTKNSGNDDEKAKSGASNNGWEVLKEDADFRANQLMLRDWDKDKDDDDDDDN